jgi:hypothetical protein
VPNVIYVPVQVVVEVSVHAPLHLGFGYVATRVALGVVFVI